MDRMHSLLNLFNYINYYPAKVKLNLKDNLIFCGIAGRVCYSQKVDLNDKRLNEELVDYLERLSKWTHYSVFAHIPVEVKVSRKDFLELKLYNLFKQYYKPSKEILYLNLRHILEAFNLNNKGNIKSIIGKFYGDLDYFKYRQGKDLIFSTQDNVAYYKINDYWDFFYIENIPTPIAVHFLRHISLNFNARSFRYTKIKTKDISQLLKDNLFKKYKDRIENIEQKIGDRYDIGIEVYKEFINEGMTTEDARMFSPQGIGTNIVVSGFSTDVDKVINQRLDDSSQHFTREISKRMKLAKEKFLRGK